ncbi:MAG: CPBP family glutamic-type intramembrane protease, partial [Pirellulales bacterium]
MWLLRRCGVTPIFAAVSAVFMTSVLFSAAHYVGPLGEPLHLYSFTFRTLAGVFFSTLFLTRGFGVTAGSHATYDLLVGLI